jgi:glycosyltransferase involved in cell wall biosynthesis
MSDSRVAVLIPCLNEQETVADVVVGFRQMLPEAMVYVFDNASTDQTGRRAAEAGGAVIYSALPGKGAVIRHMFEVVEADQYLMADGDGTYPPEFASALLAPIAEGRADMVVGTRAASAKDAFRPMHVLGNGLVCWLVNRSFGSSLTDVLSGYRAFSRRFVKSLPLLATGFDIELEMTLQAIVLDFSIKEVTTPYKTRPSGSSSKLRTYKDGFLVLRTFAWIYKDYLPGRFFGLASVVFAIASLACGFLPVLDYIRYKYVFHVPLSILATGLMVLSVLSLGIALILSAQLRYQRELLSVYRRNLTRVL